MSQRTDKYNLDGVDSFPNTMQKMQKDLRTYNDQKVSKSSYKQFFVCYESGKEGHTRKTCPLSRDRMKIKSTSRSTFDLVGDKG